MTLLTHHIRTLLAAGAFISGIGLTSCIFEYPDENCIDGVFVAFDWKNHSPSANPPGMAVLFYPVDDSDYYRFNLPANGGFVDIPYNEYNTVTFNYDSESVIFIGDSSFATLAFTTRPTVVTTYLPAPPVSRAELEGEPVMTQPEALWTATLLSSMTESGDTVRLTPRNVVARYKVGVKDITNLKSATRTIVSLSGLAGEYLAASGLPDDETPVIISGAMAAAGSSELSGILHTFGKSPSARVNTLRLYVWLADGEKKIFEWDVAGQIDSAPDPMNLEISVSGVSLPATDPTPPSGSGMQVVVANWEVINLELSN